MGPDVLGELRRVLRPGGLLYMSVKEGDGERWVEYSTGRQRFFAFYQEPELDDLLAEAGFTVRAGWLNPGQPERWIARLAVAGEVGEVTIPSP